MWAACRLAESSPVKDQERASLESLVLAAYIQKATALIGRRRRVGGNQFRHAMATFAILVDYHYTDAVLLKASVIHDLFEDIPSTDRDSIREIDADGPAVVDLVLEVTRHQDTPKPEYLARLRCPLSGGDADLRLSHGQGGQQPHGKGDRRPAATKERRVAVRARGSLSSA
jgi:hypothetical protein